MHVMKKIGHFLDNFFWPEAVAIVGATDNPVKINYRLTQNLVNLNFEGKIYPVNPRGKEILGLKTYTSLQDIPDKVDLVVTAVPAAATSDVIKQSDEIGVRHVVIVTGGFSEGGEEGKKLQREIGSFVKAKGIRTLGPNTLSPINTANNFAISYNPIRKLSRGGLSLGFQSGFYEPKVNWLFSGFRVNKMLDMGNKLDINELDVLEYFDRDPETKAIAMHVESIRSDARDFFDLLKKVSKRKPVVVFKTGRTVAGSKAAASHTGSIARENDLLFDGILKQTAAIRAQNLDEFFDFAKAVEYLKSPEGNHMAIVIMSGGEGVMATDSCELNGLEPARVSKATLDKLRHVLPPWEIPLNPFDAGVCMEFHMSNPIDFFSALSAIPEDENVDCAIMQMPPSLFDFSLSDPTFSEEMALYMCKEITRAFSKIRQVGKPFAMWRTAMHGQEEKWVELIETAGIPVFPSSERAIKALAALRNFRARRSV
jgi:acyl-CoA synthetase (NDP forming)